MENDRSYFMRRAAQERSAATRARSTKARAVHESMAKRYRDLAGSDAANADRETSAPVG